MGNIRLSQKKYSDAAKSYQQALDRDAGSSEALSGLVNSYLAQQQVDQAITAVNKQIAKVPASSAFYDLLGTVLAENKKDASGAEIALTKSLGLDSHNSDALVKLARVLVSKGATDEAIALYERFLKEDAREVSYYVSTGELYELKQDWRKAEQMYQKADDLAPDNAQAASHLASAILHNDGNLDVALSLAQVARRGMPDSPTAADTLGWVYYKRGLYDSAVDAFRDSLELAAKDQKPDDATVHYHLALAYEKTGKPALARQQLEQVLKINPNFNDVEGVKKLLAQAK
jgi:tetratricopeptide (TPR) repeat protein